MTTAPLFPGITQSRVKTNRLEIAYLEAGSGFVQRISQGDRGDEQSSPRTVMNTFYFKPPFRTPIDREEIYLTGLLSTKITPGNYPGDSTASHNWPNVAPGMLGVNMVSQTRAVLDTYQANGGQYREVVLPDCGHSPHIEKQETVFELVHSFVLEHDKIST